MSVYGTGSIISSNVFGETPYYEEQTRFKQQVLDPEFLTITDFDQALQDVQTGTITLPTLDAYARDKPAIADINLNGQSLTNLKQLSLVGGISGIASSALSVGVAALMFPNTGPQNLTNSVSMGGKIVTGVANAELPGDGDDVLTVQNKLKQCVNIATLNTMALTTSIDDRNNYSCGNYRIDDLGHALIYRNSDILVRPDPIEPNQFLPDDQKLSDYQHQAMNLHSVQQVALCLEPINRTYWTASNKQIKDGEQATLPKDFVTLDQVVHQEVAEMTWLESGTVESLPETQTSNFINETRVMFVPNPKAPVTGQFEAPTQPPSMISEEKQVANLKFVRKEAAKKHDKKEDIDLKNTYKVKNSLPPSDANDCVTKGYCDSNSKNNDGTGAVTGSILGTIGGVIGGALSSTLLSTLGSGLTAMGGITGSLAAGSAMLQTGLQVGSGLDFDAVKPPGSSDGRLINNIKEDILNGGDGSSFPPEQAEGGGLFRGPLSVSGLFSAVRNAQVGLFDV